MLVSSSSLAAQVVLHYLHHRRAGCVKGFFKSKTLVFLQNIKYERKTQKYLGFPVKSAAGMSELLTGLLLYTLNSETALLLTAQHSLVSWMRVCRQARPFLEGRQARLIFDWLQKVLSTKRLLMLGLGQIRPSLRTDRPVFSSTGSRKC